MARSRTVFDSWSVAELFDAAAGGLRLTERAEAVFTAAGLRLSDPPAAAHVIPRELWPGVDVLGPYASTLDNALGRCAVTGVRLRGALRWSRFGDRRPRRGPAGRFIDAIR